MSRRRARSLSSRELQLQPARLAAVQELALLRSVAPTTLCRPLRNCQTGMVWWRRSDKYPTTDGDAPSIFSLDSGSLSAADTSLAESSSGRSSGGDAPGPALNAPPAPSATSMCRLTPDVVTAFEHGLDMPVAALEQSCPVSLEAGCPDVVLLPEQHVACAEHPAFGECVALAQPDEAHQTIVT